MFLRTSPSPPPSSHPPHALNTEVQGVSECSHVSIFEIFRFIEVVQMFSERVWNIGVSWNGQCLIRMLLHKKNTYSKTCFRAML